MVVNSETQATTYPQQFRTFIRQTLHMSLAQVQTAGQTLPAAVRDQALHTLTFAFKLPEVWPFTRDLLVQLAPKLEQMGHRDDWLPYLARGVTLSQQYNDGAAEAELCLHVGHLYRLRSKFALANTWLTRSAELFQAQGLAHGRARALNHLAFVAWQQHSYTDAMQYVEKALALLDGLDAERASSFNVLGLVAFAQRNWQMAEHYHTQTFQIRSQSGDKRRAAWSLQNLANVVRDQGRYAEAIALYKKAATNLQEIGDSANWAAVQMHLGITYYQNKEYGASLKIYLEAEQIYTKLQSAVHLAKVCVNKGLAYLALQDWEAAQDAFRLGIDLFQALNDKPEYLNALDGLGLTYLQQGLYAQAIAIFEQGLTALGQGSEKITFPLLFEEFSSHLQEAKQKQAISPG